MEGRYHQVTVEFAGRRYNGEWTFDGKDVVVGGAYGSKRAPVGRAKPETVAAKLLRELLVARGR